MKDIISLCCMAVLLCLSTGIHAEEKDYFTLGGGAFEVLDSGKAEPAAFGNYRFAPRAFADYLGDKFRGIGPMVGLMANTDGGLFGHGAIFADIRPTENLVIWPTAGLGGYRRGNSIDLGGTFQFYLEIFMGYRMAKKHMLGISYQHISNAGVQDRNPAADSIFITYTSALPALFP